ncbi:unnamed protein product [Laminaria digitata]
MAPIEQPGNTCRRSTRSYAQQQQQQQQKLCSSRTKHVTPAAVGTLRLSSVGLIEKVMTIERWLSP